MSAYYRELNIPIPFYYFIGNKETVKRLIDAKIYNLLENKKETKIESFVNNTDEDKSPNHAKYYYVSEMITDVRAFISSLIKNIKTMTKTLNEKCISVHQTIQTDALEITDKIYEDFVKPKSHKMINQ
jgi:Zn-dependent peptidase ImmA (M78 family)